jgi:hypothetical protein
MRPCEVQYSSSLVAVEGGKVQRRVAGRVHWRSVHSRPQQPLQGRRFAKLRRPVQRPLALLYDSGFRV